jgi:hypothetical protein
VEEEAVLLIGKQFVKSRAGNQRERQVDGRDQHRAGDIQQKQLPMILEIMQKDHQRPLALVVFGCHFVPPFWFSILYIDFLSVASWAKDYLDFFYS